MRKAHRVDLDAFEKKAEEYAKFLTEGENDFKVTPLKKEFIPKDIATVLEKDIFPVMLKNNKRLFGYITEEYAKDIGTPQRYQKVVNKLKT